VARDVYRACPTRLLPGAQAPLTATALLRTTAAVAADQPGPPAWAGRYVHQIEVRTGDGYTTERSEEVWADSHLYGDGPLAKAPLNELPTDPKQLGALLLDAHKDGRWTPGGSWNPLLQAIKYDVLRDILLLLTEANTTPAQRGALITVLNKYDGFKPLESVKDHRGRAGRGVDVPAGGQLVRVIFAPETSEPRVAGRDRVAGAPLG
jgi:hypothetical protein